MMATTLEQEHGCCQLFVADNTRLSRREGSELRRAAPSTPLRGGLQPPSPAAPCPAGSGKAGNGTGRTAGMGKDRVCLHLAARQLLATTLREPLAHRPAAGSLLPLLLSSRGMPAPCKAILGLQFPSLPFPLAPPQPPQPPSPQPAPG